MECDGNIKKGNTAIQKVNVEHCFQMKSECPMV